MYIDTRISEGKDEKIENVLHSLSVYYLTIKFTVHRYYLIIF